jgi:hypothetical protein
VAETPAPLPWDEAVALAVNADRRALGLDPLDAEFGWRGFPDLSPDFLRRKAMRQLRDRFGRWRQERGSLFEEPVRPRARRGIDPFRTPTAGKASDEPVLPDPGPSDPAVPDPRSAKSAAMEVRASTGSVQRIPPEAAERVLVERGGFPRARAKKWAERGAVYEYGSEGGNPIFAFVVHEAEAMKVRLEGAQYGIDQMERLLASRRKQWNKMVDRGITGPSMDRLTGRVEDLEQKVAARRASLDDQRRKWRRAMGYDGSVTPPAMGAMVEEAAALLDAQVAKMPEWKRSGTKGFMVEFDESALMGDEFDLVSAQAKRGGAVITLNRAAYRQSTDTLPDGWEMPVGARTFGEYSIPHEAGHLIDEAHVNAPWSSMENREVWERAIASGLMSRYGMGNPREGYAEAYAMWQHDPDSPVARLYDEHFRWSVPARPGSPRASLMPDDYWDHLMTQEAPPEEPYDPFTASRAVQRFEGQAAVRAMTQGGFSASAAIEYARQGEVFTRDGKVWAFHPHRSAGPLRRQIEELDDRIDALATNPRTGARYSRLPADRRERVRALERQIRALDRQIDRIDGGEKGLRPADVAAARTLLREMEQGVKKLPRWRRDEGGPFMVEADHDLTHVRGPRVAGVAVRGSNTITINRDWLDPDWLAAKGFPADSAAQTVRHELGHVTDTRSDDPATSMSLAGREVWDLAKRLPGMTTYGRTSPAEGYAEMFQLWLEGRRDLPAVQAYARAFGWTAAQRKVPTVRGVRAHGRRLAAEGAVRPRTLGGSTNTGGSSWSRRTD